MFLWHINILKPWYWSITVVTHAMKKTKYRYRSIYWRNSPVEVATAHIGSQQYPLDRCLADVAHFIWMTPVYKHIHDKINTQKGNVENTAHDAILQRSLVVWFNNSTTFFSHSRRFLALHINWKIWWKQSEFVLKSKLRELDPGSGFPPLKAQEGIRVDIE